METLRKRCRLKILRKGAKTFEKLVGLRLARKREGLSERVAGTLEHSLTTTTLALPWRVKRQVCLSLIALLDLQPVGIGFADPKSKLRDVVFILKFLDFYGRENFIFLGFQLLVFRIFLGGQNFAGD